MNLTFPPRIARFSRFHRSRPNPYSSALIRGLTCLFLLLTTATRADSIRLHDEIGTADPKVTLSQVAELEGEYAATLGDLIVGEFAAGQDELIIQLATIRRLLSEARTNWADLSLRGRTQCVVLRLAPADPDPGVPAANDRAVTTSQALDIDHAAAGRTVGDLLTAELVRINAVPRDELEIAFRGTGDDAAWLNRSAAVGRYELEAQGTSGLGRVTIKVRRYDPSGVIEQASITAEVAHLTTAIVARQSIRRGERFSSQNVGLKAVRLTGDHGQTLQNVDLIIGQTAAASLRQGTIVLADQVAPDVLVKRGEIITVACVSGSLVVRTVGRAVENGSLGDIIAVRHEETRETFFATVSGQRQARIQSAPPAADSLAASPASQGTR